MSHESCTETHDRTHKRYFFEELIHSSLCWPREWGPRGDEGITGKQM